MTRAGRWPRRCRAAGTACLFLAVACGAYEAGGYSYDPGLYFVPPERLGLYLAGNYQPVVLPLDDVDYLELGSGWLLTLGYSADTLDAPDGRLGLEVAFARSLHRNPGASSTAEYYRFQVGVRWWETGRPRVLPYLTTGISFHDINDPGGTDVNGWGFYGGGGVDIMPVPYLSLQVDVRFHIWGGEDRFGVVTYGLTPVVGVGMSLQF